MESIKDLAIVAIVLIAVYLICAKIPFLAPYKDVIGVVCGALVAIMLIIFLFGFIHL